MFRKVQNGCRYFSKNVIYMLVLYFFNTLDPVLILFLVFFLLVVMTTAIWTSCHLQLTCPIL